MKRQEPRGKVREVAVFKSNRSQAVRIPKEFAFPEAVKKVTVTPLDGGILIKPVDDAGWTEFFARPGLDEKSAREMLEAVGDDPPPEPVEYPD